MTPEQAAEHLRVIRELMERPIRQTTRSGVAGVVAGVLALAGAALSHPVWPANEGPFDRTALFWESGAWFSPLARVVWIWLGVLVIAGTVDVLIARRRARRQGRAWWRRAQVRTLMAIVPGFMVAGLLTYIIILLGTYAMLPYGWMVGYGLALWTVGMFSITEVKVLAAAFLVTGMAGLLPEPEWLPLTWSPPALSAAVTFGGYHLVYGAVVWIRHGG
jgi:hypothetical protein